MHRPSYSCHQNIGRRAALGLFAGVFVLVGLGACQRALMPTPNIFADTDANPFTSTPEHFQSNMVDVLYVTDRAIRSEPGEPLRYGYGRSRSLAFGSCVVEIGRDLSWEDLVVNTLTKRRERALRLKMGEIHELGRAPPTPLPLVERDGELIDDPDAVAAQLELADFFRKELSRRLALTDRKEIYLFIHGFHNTFDDSAFVMAELWHFLGREGVPMIYSWPAGSKGLLRGYNYDRESGEFTVFHLKNVFRFITTLPEIDAVHVIAHSRGTDVATSALRELFIEARAAGNDPREVFKIANVVLAAPDLDMDVVAQRLSAERFPLALRQLTLYTSRYDKAIGIASWLFGGLRRLGQFRFEDSDPDRRATNVEIPQLTIIEAKIKPRGNAHSYFRQNPAVSSDLIRLLKDGAEPGSDLRPLNHIQSIFWSLDDQYPFSDPAKSPAGRVP